MQKIQFIIDPSESMKIWNDKVVDIINGLLDETSKKLKLEVLPFINIEEASENILSDLIYVILTDYIDSFWGTKKSYSFLETLSKNNYVSILNLLPARMHKRTALDDTWRIKFIENKNKTNKGLISDIDTHFESLNKGEHLRIPIMTNDNISFKHWVNNYLGEKDTWLHGSLIAKEDISERSSAEEISLDDLIFSFNVSVSPEGRKIAYYLSIMDVFSIPVLKHFTDNLVPDVNRTNLAEFFLSGLLVKKEPVLKEGFRNIELYEFKEGVQENLFSNLYSSFAHQFTKNNKDLLIQKMECSGISPNFYTE